MLSLSEALASGRLDEFIAQEEARGVDAVDPRAFDAVICAAVKPRQSAGQTSRSSSHGGSGEK
jgi:hypothetical protein